MSFETRRLGRTDVAVTTLGFGSAALGELFVKVPEPQAHATLQAAWDAGIRYFDTAPWYGLGLAEHRLGSFLHGQKRDEFRVSTKVGRWLRPSPKPESYHSDKWAGGLPFDVVFDYGYDGIMRAIEQIWMRLTLPRIDLLLIHDLDLPHHHTEGRVRAHLDQLSSSGWRALDQLKSAGIIGAVGAGINVNGMIPRLLDAADLDAFLVAMPYTLMDQAPLADEFPLCERHGAGIVIGGVFASGLLATGPVAGAKYNYRDATAEELDRCRRIERVCAAHTVPLAAAALQFPLGHPIVASVIPGALSPDQVVRNVENFRYPIPAGLWSDLKSENLIRTDAPTP
jgi:D-threo-aldose 1-dehydrogenase